MNIEAKTNIDGEIITINTNTMTIDEAVELMITPGFVTQHRELSKLVRQNTRLVDGAAAQCLNAFSEAKKLGLSGYELSQLRIFPLFDVLANAACRKAMSEQGRQSFSAAGDILDSLRY
jgi:hypothetical protein